MEDDDLFIAPPVLYSGYTLIFNGETYTHSDELLDYNFCEDLSFRNIRTSKVYRQEQVFYEVLFTSFVTSNQPKVPSYLFYIKWDPLMVDDLSMEEAFQEVLSGVSDRKALVEFFIVDNDAGYSNITIANNEPQLVDQRAQVTIALDSASTDCRTYGHKIGKVAYTYRGHLYTTDRTDSIFVDQFDLTLYTPTVL